MEHQAQALLRGETVSFRPTGNSMIPRIYSGQRVTLAPLETPTLAVDDIVLCKIKGRLILHKVGAIQVIRSKTRYRIENMKGKVNGWIPIARVFGKVISVED